MKALSIRSPWWFYILYGGKLIENRDWPTRQRGTILIHASKYHHREKILTDIQACRMIYASNNSSPMNAPYSTWGELKPMLGHIVGKVDIVDCVSRHSSPWFFGKYGFVLENPIALAKPFAVKGALGFFEVDVPCGVSF